MNTLEPVQLTPAELAVAYQVYLGQRLPGGDSLLADLGVSASQVAEARAGLLARGWLQPTPDQRDVMLAPRLWRLFGTVLYPQTLGVVTLTRPNQPAQQVSVSWQPGRIVLNRVDAAGLHHLVPLASAAAVASAILGLCGIDGSNGAHPAGEPLLNGPADPDQLVREASVRALFLLVVEPGGPRETPEALSWIVAGGRPWLLAQRDQASAVLTPTTPADLRQLLENIAQQYAEGALDSS